MPSGANDLAQLHNIELKSYHFKCNVEQLRTPRLVRIGIFQHKLPLPPSTPIEEQRNALFKLANDAINVASASGVNIFSFQEAWSKLNNDNVISAIFYRAKHSRYAVRVLYERETTVVRICGIC